MIHLLSLIFTLPLAASLLAALVLTLSLQAHPLVHTGTALTISDVERAKRLLQRQDPRRQAGDEAVLEISESDLNLVLGYLLQRRFDGRGRASMTQDTLHGQFTWRLPDGPTPPYLNMALNLKVDNDRSRVTNMRLGRLDLPIELDTRWLADLLGRIFTREEFPLIHSQVRRVIIEPRHMTLYYQWGPQLIAQARGLTMSEAERAKVNVHYRALAGFLHQRPATLADLLQSSFRLADERSPDKSEAVIENRAALIALGLYALGNSAEKLLGNDEELPPLPRDWVTLRGRADLTRHFLVSAAISAASGGDLSDLLGLHKEWSDSRSGSGFSFADLAADRAGARFGIQATASRTSAKQLQQTTGGGIRDRDLLPPIGDLPENLSKAEFELAFGGIGAPRYKRILDTIDRRLNALPLYTPHTPPVGN